MGPGEYLDAAVKELALPQSQSATSCPGFKHGAMRLDPAGDVIVGAPAVGKWFAGLEATRV